MKKLLFAAAALFSLSFVSCNTSSDSPAYAYIWMLSGMETTFDDDAQTEKQTSKYTYTATTTGGKVVTSDESVNFTSWPLLTLQQITGDTLSKITYSYGKQGTLTARRHTTDGRVIEDSLKLNAQGMAYELLKEGSDPAPYYIAYSETGGRTKVGKAQMDINNSRYVSTTVEGEIVAHYYYSAAANFISLQQYPIPGAPYYWATDNFGRQSQWLLEKAVVRENGAEVTYTYTYLFDINGFVTSEVILRDMKPFRTNKYKYAQGIVTEDTTTPVE